jgi:hypothetical protein
MGFSNAAQFIGSFRKRYIESRLPQSNTLDQKLQRKGGFARTGCPLDQIKPVRRQAAA